VPAELLSWCRADAFSLLCIFFLQQVLKTAFAAESEEAVLVKTTTTFSRWLICVSGVERSAL
jgi:hypothetical protein